MCAGGETAQIVCLPFYLSVLKHGKSTQLPLTSLCSSRCLYLSSLVVASVSNLKLPTNKPKKRNTRSDDDCDLLLYGSLCTVAAHSGVS